MRKLFTGIVAGLGLATVMVGSAAAESDSYLRQSPLTATVAQDDNGQQAASANGATAQDETTLDRSRSAPADPYEAGKAWLYRSPEGVVISPGN